MGSGMGSKMVAELSAKAIAALPPRKSPYRIAPLLYVSKRRPPGFWLMMYVSPTLHRRVEMSLGPVRDPAQSGARAEASGLSIAEAKAKALEYRAQIVRGRCPLSERQAAQTTRKLGQSGKRGPHTFAEVAEAYVEFHRPTWANAKHVQQWENTLSSYVFPTIGNLPIGRVDVGEVMLILEPIWRTKPNTASRIRGRIETIIDYAKARKWFTGANPAAWRGHLDQLLPRPGRVRAVQHRPAMDWREVPAFYQRLAEDRDGSALALRYLILCALRSGETRFTTIGELDREHRIHTIPARRTKTKRADLRVPLSDEALAVLDLCEARRTDDSLFGGRKSGAPIAENTMREKLHDMVPNLTVHGFRSSFRDFCADAGVPREIAEACLGHAVGNQVEAAYLRSDVLEQRRAVMERWAQFLTAPASGAAVVALARRG
jgi:integrase